MRLKKLAPLFLALSAALFAARFGIDHIGRIVRLADPQIAPDGKSIAFLYVENATRQAGALDAMKPWSGVIGEDGVEIQQVWATYLANGTTERLTQKDIHVYEFAWSPDSQSIVYVGNRPPGEDNWWTAQLRVILFNRNGPPENQP